MRISLHLNHKYSKFISSCYARPAVTVSMVHGMDRPLLGKGSEVRGLTNAAPIINTTTIPSR